MYAKLIKEKEGHYILLMEGTNDLSGIIASSVFNNEYTEGKLSIKNCQAIERGWDLGEIKRKVFSGFDGLPDSFTMVAVEITVEVMIELMGDKQFSEDDLEKAFFHVQNEPTFDIFKQSLQQTEWDVEIEMVPALSNSGNAYYGDIPKLDEQGCLILKKK